MSSTLEENFGKMVRACNREDVLRMYLINVGNGNFIIVTLGDKCGVFDAGTNEKYSGVEPRAILENIEKAKEILKSKKIEFFFASHTHADHINLIEDVLKCAESYEKEVKIVIGGRKEEMLNATQNFMKNLIHNGILDRKNTFFIFPDYFKTHSQKFEVKVLENAEKYSLMLSECFDNMVDIKLYAPILLGPIYSNTDFLHDYRNVFVKIDFQQRGILLPGDGTEETFINMFQPGVKPTTDIFGHVDVYVAPHHGSANNCIDIITYECQQRAVLISGDAKAPKCIEFGLPRFRAVEKLRYAAKEKVGNHVLSFWSTYKKGRSYRERPEFISVEEAVFETGQQSFIWEGEYIRGISLEIVPVAVVDKTKIDEESIAYDMEFVPKDKKAQ